MLIKFVSTKEIIIIKNHSVIKLILGIFSMFMLTVNAEPGMEITTEFISSKTTSNSSNEEETYPGIKMAEYSGDILLGAIFPIHQHVNYSCGCIQTEGIQQLEAMIYVLDRINNDPNILPGIRLGTLAIDSCESPHHALEQAIDFIKSFVARTNRRLNEPEFHCQDKSAPVYKNGKLDQIIGIIGGQSSEVSLQLANLLRIFHIPQVSYMSTSPTLSNEHLYQYFFRTVPSDINQVDAIVDILRKFNWTYVSVVYSDTEYGNHGYDLLTTAAARYNICISSPQAINVERFGLVDYDNLITTLMHKINAKVVIVYTDRHVARKIMKAAKRRFAGGLSKRSDRFVWIASDAWCCREFVVHGLEPIIEGTISVTPLHYPLDGFADYFRSLKPDEERSGLNPWFAEFWQQHFKCSLPSTSPTSASIMINGVNTAEQEQETHQVTASMDSDSESKEYPEASLAPICNTSMELDIDDLQQSPSLHFVRDAFYSFTMTLHNIHQRVCNGTKGLCERMKELIINGKYVSEQLKQVEFRDEGGRMFRFQNNGDAPPRYTVVNFQRLPNGTYQWRPVGTYMIGENENKAKLKLEIDLLKFKHDQHRFPKSFCSEPCSSGQAKLQLEGDTCCWLCTNCSQYQYLIDEFHCDECPLGTLPNVNKTNCFAVPTIYLSLTEWWTISAIVFASVGMLATVCTWAVFLRYAETPIIKASGRELSNLHLAGIFLSFAVTFVIISKPTPLTCALTRFLLGFCYTVCYSAIVTKTNRISRIFQHRSCQKPRFTSPKSQLIITFMLISIEIFINIVWFFYTPPDIKLVYSTREIALLICSGSDNVTYLFGLIYPLILIGFCTVYAFKTRKCPEGFNEARYITFTNYTTCVVWFAFLPLYVMLSTTTPLRAITLSSLLSVSGAVQLSCLFVPKMYIALLKPEKNTRETVMLGGHRSFIFGHSRPGLLQRPHHHHPVNHDVIPQLSQRPSSNQSDRQFSPSKNENRAPLHNQTELSTTSGLMLEPYSTSSEVDTQTTIATASIKIFPFKSGSIVSMPDKLLSLNGDSSSSKQQQKHENHYIEDMDNQILPSQLANGGSATKSQVRPFSAGAVVSTKNASTFLPNGRSHHNHHNGNDNGVGGELSDSSSSAAPPTLLISQQASLPFKTPPTSSFNGDNNATTVTTATIIKHDTKAVLENGHQRWPSIKLEQHLTGSSTTTTTTVE